MQLLLVTISLLASQPVLGELVFLDATEEKDIAVYAKKNELLESLLSTQCHITSPTSESSVTTIKGVKAYYDILLTKLVQCKVPYFAKPISTQTPTPLVLNEACSSAVELTESWRLDSEGSHYQPGGPRSSGGFACDHRKGLQWFRFSGKGGNRMLDSCPKWFSCGGRYPYWTDDLMPKAVGEITEVSIYGVVGNDCKHVTQAMEVVRCSWDSPHDFVYRYVGKYYQSCSNSFCGMA